MIRTAACRFVAPCLATVFVLFAGIAKADDLPRFVVPGHEPAMQTLEEMHALHAPTRTSSAGRSSPPAGVETVGRSGVPGMGVDVGGTRGRTGAPGAAEMGGSRLGVGRGGVVTSGAPHGE